MHDDGSGLGGLASQSSDDRRSSMASVDGAGVIKQRSLKSLKPSKSRNGRPVKCSCSKSKCLKLYCDCFSVKKFCDGCTCKDCQNTESNRDEVERNRALVLKRQPKAFDKKFVAADGELAVEVQEKEGAKHARGCNCARSKCLKNYCECFQMNIACSEKCKCTGCANPNGCKPDAPAGAEPNIHPRVHVDHASVPAELRGLGHDSDLSSVGLTGVPGLAGLGDQLAMLSPDFDGLGHHHHDHHDHHRHSIGALPIAGAGVAMMSPGEQLHPTMMDMPPIMAPVAPSRLSSDGGPSMNVSDDYLHDLQSIPSLPSSQGADSRRESAGSTSSLPGPLMQQHPAISTAASTAAAFHAAASANPIALVPIAQPPTNLLLSAANPPPPPVTTAAPPPLGHDTSISALQCEEQLSFEGRDAGLLLDASPDTTGTGGYHMGRPSLLSERGGTSSMSPMDTGLVWNEPAALQCNETLDAAVEAKPAQLGAAGRRRRCG